MPILMVLPLVDRLMPPVPDRLEVAGAPMLMVLPLVDRLSAPVADRLDCAGAEMVMVLLLKPTLAAPPPLMLTALTAMEPVLLARLLAPVAVRFIVPPPPPPAPP